MDIGAEDRQPETGDGRATGLDGAEASGDEPSAGQLQWRTRRGQRELDLILGRYLEARYPKAAREEQRAFAALLERSDPDILDWVLGRAAAPAEMKNVIRALTATG